MLPPGKNTPERQQLAICLRGLRRQAQLIRRMESIVDALNKLAEHVPPNIMFQIVRLMELPVVLESCRFTDDNGRESIVFAYVP